MHLKCLHTNNDRECTSNEFERYYKVHDIRQEKMEASTTQLNGVAKRLNCITIKKVRYMLRISKLPKIFWGKTVSNVIYLINQTPSVPSIPENL